MREAKTENSVAVLSDHNSSTGVT